MFITSLVRETDASKTSSSFSFPSLVLETVNRGRAGGRISSVIGQDFGIPHFRIRLHL